MISRKKHPGIPMSKPCCQRNSSPFKGEVGRGMGAKGRISSRPDYPIPTPSLPLKGRERVPRSGMCIAGNHLIGHEVSPVAQRGRAGTKNGKLLALAATRFDVFLTMDQTIEFQQNVANSPLGEHFVQTPRSTRAVQAQPKAGAGNVGSITSGGKGGRYQKPAPHRGSNPAFSRWLRILREAAPS